MYTRTPQLSPSGIPTSFYNLFADAGLESAPPLDPGTRQPIAPEKLAAIFPLGLLEQEVSREPLIPIPEPVLEAYGRYRPTPLRRAATFERALGTRCTILYKYEGASPVGSHKLNTALAQAYFNHREGITRIATETGAGQWGTAMAFACREFQITCTVYMVDISYRQKPGRRTMMEIFGAEVFASPSERTSFGRRLRAERPDHPGSLGIAISEAIEDVVTHPGTKYALGSVLNHVLLHQTVIGQEALGQLETLGCFPDAIVGCHGGGSNFAGLAFPFVPHKLEGRALRIVAAEPTSCPTLTKGRFDYDFGDAAQTTPLMKMYSLGPGFVPDPIHAGGLRYHGAAPLVSELVARGLVEARAYEQTVTFDIARRFAAAEGIIPAPEAAHAIAAVAELAAEADAGGRPQTILFNLSGHGLLDLSAYAELLGGTLR